MLPGTFRSMTMGDALRAVAARDPGKVTVQFGEKRVTAAQLAARVGQLRDAAIGTLGVARGDVAGIVARNCCEFIEVVAGLPDAGAAVATINPRLAPAEVRQALDDCGARVVFVDAAARALVERALGEDLSARRSCVRNIQRPTHHGGEEAGCMWLSCRSNSGNTRCSSQAGSNVAERILRRMRAL